MATRRRRNEHAIPILESVKVKNYRVLKDVELTDLRPLTVLLGKNGSGKSTLFDVFAFLSDCFSDGLRKAWDTRGRFRELRSRDAKGPIVIEVRYREPGLPPITYHLAIDETEKGPMVDREWLQWTRTGGVGAPFKFLNFSHGQGSAVSGEMPDDEDSRQPENLKRPDAIAVSTLGQFEKHPRVAALRDFITGWYLSYLTTTTTGARNTPEAGPQERLTQNGSNLANVIQYLREQHPARLDKITQVLRRRVPGLGDVRTKLLESGHLLLQIKDAAFGDPVQARFASDGTLKLLAYLTVLYDPEPPPFIGIEEPENFLYPEFLPELAEECRIASKQSQVLVTTHSPFFVNGCAPDEVRVVHRGPDGYAHVWPVAQSQKVKALMEYGAQLGHLWMEGHLQPDDPLDAALASGKAKTPPPNNERTRGSPGSKARKKKASR